ncbi:MAG: aminotransferase class V-fold PLP-dependent enzyme, partial [Verrucomicrobiota bacterium]
EALRRREFPVVEQGVFLGHAGVCPLPRRVAEAAAAHARDASRADQEEAVAPGTLSGTRQLAARLLGADPAEIALVGPTSLALSFIAAGLRFRRGDQVLVYRDDYPSNVYPWLALASQGVKIRYLNVRELGRLRPIDLEGQLDESVRLVALSSAHYLSGWRLDVLAIGALLRRRGILFCLDAIQTLGAFPTPVANVDILAADAHKWLLGPCAAGILYVRKEVRPQIRPVVHGWHNLQCPDYLTQDDLVFHEGPRRYEAGTHNFIGLHGLKAALELVQEVGVGAIAAELARKRLWLVPRLQAKGYTVLQGDAHADNAGGITSIHREGTDLKALHRKLREAGVTTSLRILPGGQPVLRLSPHFYNTDEELQRCLDLL